MRLSIIIPVLNYEEVLEENIKRVKRVAKGAEILLVYDITKPEFKEKAFAEARNLKRKYQVKTLFRLDQRGFGSALRLGFKHVNGDLVLIMMGDLCDDPQTIPKMIEKINEGYDVVAGCRYMEGGGIVGNTPKQRISSAVSLLINTFSTLKCRDITNAFKMYRKGVLDAVETTSNSFDISAELALKAAAQGFEIGQVPTVWKNRNAGQSNFKVLKEAKKYFMMFLFSVYTMPSLLTRIIIAMLALLLAYMAFVAL
jgi:glycosyltransferase involved in cell wall biosynthesis